VNFREFDSDGVIWCVDYQKTNELLPPPLRDILKSDDANIFTTTPDFEHEGLFDAAVGQRAGGALLGARGGWSGSAAGAMSIALACLCWALDNNLSARLALKDPIRVLRIKALCAGGANLVLALALGGSLPPLGTCAAALAVGSVSYGASLLLYLRAQRALGAARQAVLFAAAPFAGAVASVPLLGDRPAALDLAAAVLMAVGIAGLLRARHAHLHTHEPLEHDHMHVHDAHHQHAHGGDVGEPHAHPHQHDPVTHAHPHVSDSHHRHPHR